MSDFKQKIMDILFEDDGTEEVAPEASNTQNEKKKASSVRAKDILYDKNNSHQTFIEYLSDDLKQKDKEEKVINKKEIKEKEESYHSIENVSPIFGSVNGKPEIKDMPKKDVVEEHPAFYSSGEFTGIVISPIFGYDSIKANEARKSLDFDEQPIKVEKEEKKVTKEVVDEERTIVLEPRKHEDTEEMNFDFSKEDEYSVDEEELTSDDDLLMDGTFELDSLNSEERDLFDELIGDDD